MGGTGPVGVGGMAGDTSAAGDASTVGVVLGVTAGAGARDGVAVTDGVGVGVAVAKGIGVHVGVGLGVAVAGGRAVVVDTPGRSQAPRIAARLSATATALIETFVTGASGWFGVAGNPRKAGPRF